MDIETRKDEAYESSKRKLEVKRALKIGLVVLTIMSVVIAPALWCWDQSVQKRFCLRDAKNVVLNMELLSLEFYAFNNSIVDTSRLSGMSEYTEEKVRSFSGADGFFKLVSWDEENQCVENMYYQLGDYFIEYHYDVKNDTKKWDIYWKVQVIE